jgi:hypothetical protein
LFFSIVVFSSMLAAQGVGDVPGFTDSQAKNAIKDWKKENRPFVKLDNAAADELRKSLSGEKTFKSPDLFPLGESPDDFIVGSYLYELRDRKYASMGSPSFSNDLKIDLGPADVESFTFAAYVASLRTPTPGELSVRSQPPGASITIDGKPQGITDRDFVVSKGKHLISVKLAAAARSNPSIPEESKKMECTATLDVQDDITTFKCEEKKKEKKAEKGVK